jgi:thioester reductase-like protein
MNTQPNLEWRQFNWEHSLAFEPLVEGCAAVLHLGAELQRIDKMQRSNVDVTRAPVRASERTGAKFFCYVSSIAVYGSSLDANVSEKRVRFLPMIAI